MPSLSQFSEVFLHIFIVNSVKRSVFAAVENIFPFDSSEAELCLFAFILINQVAILVCILLIAMLYFIDLARCGFRIEHDHIELAHCKLKLEHLAIRLCRLCFDKNYILKHSALHFAEYSLSNHIPSPGGKPRWNASNIRSILTNEKYKGDALLQKTYKVDFLTKKKKVNEGEIPQYYVRNNHEPIIDPDTFDMVQTLRAERRPGSNRRSSVSIFSIRIKCGDCGGWYEPKVWHSNDPYRNVICQCNHKFDGQKCATPTLTEDEIRERFLRAANTVIGAKERFIAVYERSLAPHLATDDLERELADIEAEIAIAAELVEDCIRENAHVALDQAEYQKRFDGLAARYDKAKARDLPR